jgi:hypothetical protein
MARRLNDQLSAVSYQPSAVSHQQSAISRQPSAISHQLKRNEELTVEAAVGYR